MNREEWLTKLTESMRPLYQEAGAQVPDKIRLTCGWPSKSPFAKKNRTIGECWQSAASKDGTTEVFISPCVAEGERVAEILAHELVHATGAKGHRGTFKRIATKIGLEGPMRGTHAGVQLLERLNALISPLGPYAHAELDKTQSPHTKQGTRLLKIVCPACGYTARTTQKWLSVGVPTCPCGEEMESEITESEGE